jgi:hypothetical protein
MDICKPLDTSFGQLLPSYCHLLLPPFSVLPLGMQLLCGECKFPPPFSGERCCGANSQRHSVGKNCQRQGVFLVNLLFFNQGFTQEVNQLCDPSAPDVLSTIIQVFWLDCRQMLGCSDIWLRTEYFFSFQYQCTLQLLFHFYLLTNSGFE